MAFDSSLPRSGVASCSGEFHRDVRWAVERFVRPPNIAAMEATRSFAGFTLTDGANSACGIDNCRYRFSAGWRLQLAVAAVLCSLHSRLMGARRWNSSPSAVVADVPRDAAPTRCRAQWASDAGGEEGDVLACCDARVGGCGCLSPAFCCSFSRCVCRLSLHCSALLLCAFVASLIPASTPCAPFLLLSSFSLPALFVSASSAATSAHRTQPRQQSEATRERTLVRGSLSRPLPERAGSPCRALHHLLISVLLPLLLLLPLRLVLPQPRLLQVLLPLLLLLMAAPRVLLLLLLSLLHPPQHPPQLARIAIPVAKKVRVRAGLRPSPSQNQRRSHVLGLPRWK